MTPGPNKILKTALTGSLVKITTISSYNTIGARFWTDGKREAPMFPDQPRLRRHPSNDELFWTAECEKIAVEEPRGVSDDYADTPFAQEPSVEDYWRALATGVASSHEKEHYIRVRLWWATNDPVRRGETNTLSDRDNLLKLLALLDDSDPNQRLMAAEVCRELGDFDRASVLLDFPFPEDFNHAVNLIKKFNEQKDVTVRQMTSANGGVPSRLQSARPVAGIITRMKNIRRIWLSLIIGVAAEGIVDALVAVFGRWDRPVGQQSWAVGDWLVGFYTLVHWPSIWVQNRIFSVSTTGYFKTIFVVVTSAALLSAVTYLLLRGKDKGQRNASSSSSS